MPKTPPDPHAHDLCVCGQEKHLHVPCVDGCPGYRSAAVNLGIVDERKRFVQIDEFVIDRYIKELGVYGFALYSILCRFANYRSRQTFVGQSKMAELMGCSRSTIGRELANLEKVGLIRRTSGKAEGIFNLITLIDPRSAQPVEAVQDADNKGEGAAPETQGGDSHEVTGAAMTDGGCVNDDLPIRKNESSNETTTPRLFETGPEQGNKPKQTKPLRATPDTLHHHVVAEIDRLYEIANPGVDCPWNGLAFGRLKKAFESAPKWGVTEWVNCVRNRFKSENINHGDPPESFIPSLKKYIKGPLDQYNRSKSEGDGNEASRGHQRGGVSRVDQAFHELRKAGVGVED